MDRAIAFYEKVFDVKMERHAMGPLDMAWFPGFPEGKGAGGSLVGNENYKPSTSGVLIYFTARSGDVANELARAEQAGGKILVPKKLIALDIGYLGAFVDTEGNLISVHSRQG